MSFVSAHSPSPSCDSPSPSPSTSSHALPDAGQPPRKRSRSEMTSEERKEARAHRNRIAAQNSRDRRKAQFSWLERRVAELEEENRRLRAGLPVPPVPAPPPPAGLHIPVLSNIAPAMMPAPQPIPVLSPEDAIRASRDLERERENEELKERIKTLERGWDAVVKALAAQGLPTGLSTTPAAPTTASTHSTQPLNPVPVSTTPSTSTTPSSPPTTSPTTTTKPPISSATHFSTGFPSPAPSHASDFDFEAPVSAPSPLAFTGGDPRASLDGPAAGGLVLSRGQSVGVYPSPSTSFIEVSDDATADDDAKMEDLFREIVVDDSTSSATGESSGRPVQEAASAAPSVTSTTTEVGKTETQGQGESLGKRKREEDEESSGATKKLAFDGLELGIGANAGLDFGFDWSNTASSTTTAPLTPDEMQQMLNQIDTTNAMMQFPNDLGLDMTLDLGIWSNTATAGVF